MITKFRGKAKNASTPGFEAGGWLYGSLINNAFFFEDGTPACSILDTSYIAYDCWEDLADWMDDFEVDPATVGQWTGKKDKKGKEIYLGDFSISNDGCWVVEWVDGGFAFVHARDGDTFMFSELFMDEEEITGNIHDNPELLK